jgi:hypothetical protein
MRERAIQLLNDVGRFTAKAVPANDGYAFAMAWMKAVVDRDFRRVLMGSMLSVCPVSAKVT